MWPAVLQILPRILIMKLLLRAKSSHFICCERIMQMKSHIKIEFFAYLCREMNNPFEYTPDEACQKAFADLAGRLEALRAGSDPRDAAFIRELDEGKMLGVLIAADDSGVSHTLYAFSGQLGSGGFHFPGFVGPAFDYLSPDGHFKRGEREISQMNSEIADFERGELARVQKEYSEAKERADAEVAEFREKCRAAKAARKSRREAGDVSGQEAAEMIRQSQFEKAELHRLKKRVAARLLPFEAALSDARARLDEMRRKRRADSEALQQWLFTNFRLLNAHGESRSLSEIFAETPMRIPPSGAGECCAPKLLQEAYRRRLTPIAIAEYWYGAPKGGEVRIHGEHYPACRGKCLPVLSWMLRGLDVVPSIDAAREAVATRQPEIIYENQWFCVVSKPGGMLSVPGKGAAKSVEQWLSERYGPEKQVKMAHRLDQDTSGLIIAAFGPEAHKTLQALFATGKISKTYIAVLDGDYRRAAIPSTGRISLPLAPDWLDRPRQRVDLRHGKEAITDYEFTHTADGRSRITFRPLTGRTHQLRLHAASPQGLGMSIVGDRLYAPSTAAPHIPLHLHAAAIAFTFPLDSRPYTFRLPPPF